MRIEVLQELDPGDAILEIPWANSHDSQLRYIDLKATPEKIQQLAECGRFPQIGGFLAKINAQASGLRSAKCDSWTATELGEDERLDFDFPHKVASYVDVVFERLELNLEISNHLQLGESLTRLLSGLRVQAQGEIVVRKCLFHEEERWGYSSTLFVHAYGSSFNEARHEWGRAAVALGEAFEKIGRKLPHGRAAGRSRV